MAVKLRSRWISYLFCLPALMLMFIILMVPIFVASVLSFTDYSLGNDSFSWVGWKNYEVIFGRSSYQKMLWATTTYVLVVVPISIILGLGAALLINSLRRFGDFYKAIYFLPVSGICLCTRPSASLTRRWQAVAELGSRVFWVLAGYPGSMAVKAGTRLAAPMNSQTISETRSMPCRRFALSESGRLLASIWCSI